MFDFLRDLGKSAAEKRQEQMNAYLDGELPPESVRRFEAELKQDPALRAEVAELRQIKRSVQQLPQVRAPRNYTLDLAVYGRPAPQSGTQWLPVLRVATALTAFFFILVVALDLLSPTGQVPFLRAGQEAAVADVSSEAVEVEGEAMEVTRVVTEMAAEPVEEEVEMAEEEAPAPPRADAQVEETFTVEEAAEAAVEEIPAAAEEADTGAAATGVAEATAAPPTLLPGGGGGQAPLPTGTAEEAGARLMQAYPAEGAEETVRATETAPQLQSQTEEAVPEKEPVVETVSPIRIAQVVLGLLLAGLLVAWALVRRD